VQRNIVVAYSICALIWGTTWYAIRACLVSYPTFDAVALRFAIAALFLVPLAVRMRPWPTRAQWGYLVLAGALDAAAYALVYLGEERVPGAVAAVVFGTLPLFQALTLAVVRIEPNTRRHLIGAVVSLVGVGVLFLDRLDVSPRQGVGVAMVVGAVIVTTWYTALMKRHGGAVHVVVSTTIFLGVAAVALGIVALALGRPMPWPPPFEPSAALLYLAVIGSVVAFLSYFWLLNRTSLQLTSTLVFVYPLIALLTDRLFERAIPLGPRAYVGAAITLGGLAVSLRRG
jgi:drug/metabolite transporter (DMT)-like permease